MDRELALNIVKDFHVYLHIQNVEVTYERADISSLGLVEQPKALITDATMRISGIATPELAEAIGMVGIHNYYEKYGPKILITVDEVVDFDAALERRMVLIGMGRRERTRRGRRVYTRADYE